MFQHHLHFGGSLILGALEMEFPGWGLQSFRSWEARPQALSLVFDQLRRLRSGQTTLADLCDRKTLLHGIN